MLVGFLYLCVFPCNEGFRVALLRGESVWWVLLKGVLVVY